MNNDSLISKVLSESRRDEEGRVRLFPLQETHVLSLVQW